jgi:hypothetical protein
MSAKLIGYARIFPSGLLRVLGGEAFHTPWERLEGATPGPTGLPPLKARWFFDLPFPKFGRMDPLSKLAVAASQMLAPALPEVRDEVAQVGGTMLGSLEVDLQYEHTRLAGHPSPALFVYTLPSMFQGEVAILHRLRGRCTLLSAGRLSGLTALATAVRWIEKGRASHVLAIAADAGGPGARALHPAETHQRAAAAWLLSAKGSGPALARPSFQATQGARALEPGSLPYGLAGIEALERAIMQGETGTVSAQAEDRAVSLDIAAQ